MLEKGTVRKLYNLESIPFFSVIVPTFNSGKTIVSCIESILNQSFKNFELLIIDGLSLDNTVLAAKLYQRKYPNVICISEPDCGVYDAMNKGLEIARGEWVFFLGSDDSLNSYSVLEEISNCYKGGFSVVYGNVRVMGDTLWAKKGDIYDGEFSLKKLLIKNICHQAIFYKRKYLTEQIGNYKIDYRICADWDINLRCWGDKPFLYINLIITNFYAGGVTSDLNEIDHNFFRDYQNNVLQYFGKKTLKQNFKMKELKKMGILLRPSLFEQFRILIINKSRYILTHL